MKEATTCTNVAGIYHKGEFMKEFAKDFMRQNLVERT